MPERETVIKVRGVVVGFGTATVLKHLDLDVYRGEILGFVGGSGAGKSVLMRTIIGLVPKREGTIEVFGVDLGKARDIERRAIERRWGILFQQGALFSSLTVRENLQFPMREYLKLSQRLMDELALAKLEMVGLSATSAGKCPPSSPAAWSSAWHWRARSRSIRRSCSSTSPPPAWTRSARVISTR